jgi:hypothetical protein
MISVVVLGQPYWGTRIARTLDGRAPDLQAKFVGQREYGRLLARPPRADHVVLLRAGYRIGASTSRGRLFDAYWSALRRASRSPVACHYWLGTDVMDTIAEARAGTLRRQTFEDARVDLHLADASWLAEELREVGVEAQYIHLPQPYHCPESPPPMPDSFRVLTYLPGDRFTFYGGDIVLEAARHLPDVAFDVIGRPGPVDLAPMRNVAHHGWVAGMSGMYARVSVVVRIPVHDGLGATVVEGLLHARHVIYSHHLPFVHGLSPVTVEGLVEELARLRDAHLRGGLELNLGGRWYARAAYDETRLAERLVAQIRARL